MNITDDPDPSIGDRVAAIHRERFANDAAPVDLVENLGSTPDGETATNPGRRKGTTCGKAQLDAGIRR